MQLHTLILFALILAGEALGGVGDWKTYTSKREIRDLTMDQHGIVWTATSGGMFSYRISDSSFNQFTTSEGLKSIDLTAIAIDAQGSIWIGAQNGFLHKYSPATNSWVYVSDIALRGEPVKRINALQVYGDTLFILSDIGASVFFISKMEFGDTYTRFGAAGNQITGGVTALQLFNDSLWVGTRNGIAATPITNPNASAPESWKVWTTAAGLCSNTISGLLAIPFHSTYIDSDLVPHPDPTKLQLFAATSSGLCFYGSGYGWTVEDGTQGQNILDLSGTPWKIYFVTSSELNDLESDGLGELSRSVSVGFLSPLTCVLNPGFVGTLATGLNVPEGNQWASRVPPGPPSNRFIGIAADERGVVWSGTGASNGEGFMSYDGTTWKSYTVSQDSRLRTNDFWKVSIGRNNTKWIGNWGSGVALVDDLGTVRKVLNTSNGLSPSIDPTFVVVGGVATDANGVAWLTDRTGRNDTAAVTFAPDSSLGYVRGLTPRDPLRIFADVVIDQNGTKWFSNFSRFENVLPVGLYYYNERFALPGTSNGWGSLTSDNGLTSNKIYSLAVGKEGDLWVGSDQGVSIIFNPGSPRQIYPYHPLQDQVIQGIVVDPLNNKWIATRQGVFVLSTDGTSILERYTVENTDGKLLDNDVASIAIDGRSGTMYFGTEKGLSSLRTSAVESNRSFNELSFAPNPFYLPSQTSLTVDGLVQNSLMKVFSIDGNLIKEIRTPGGRVGYWDGTDTHGNIVGSGIYLVVAYSEDGSQTATGKLAVVRR